MFRIDGVSLESNMIRNQPSSLKHSDLWRCEPSLINTDKRKISSFYTLSTTRKQDDTPESTSANNHNIFQNRTTTAVQNFHFVATAAADPHGKKTFDKSMNGTSSQ
nr:hypothetical protein [Tanacetum cinerariifolium]